MKSAFKTQTTKFTRALAKVSLIALTLLVALPPSAQAQLTETPPVAARDLSQLSVGAKLTFIRDINIPPTDGSLKLHDVAIDQMSCSLHFPPADHDRILSRSRSFVVRSVDMDSEPRYYYDPPTAMRMQYVLRFDDGSGLSLSCYTRLHQPERLPDGSYAARSERMTIGQFRALIANTFTLQIPAPVPFTF